MAAQTIFNPQLLDIVFFFVIQLNIKALALRNVTQFALKRVLATLTMFDFGLGFIH
jgi:hypothetical protein